MLSVRNAILAASLLMIVAVVTSVINMLRTPDSDGLGNDTYGTRGRGQRGLFEVLHELGIATTRSFSPPDAPDVANETLVFLGPDPQLVGFEPAYLHRLRSWVEQGGRIVVAPRERDAMTEAMQERLDEPPPTVLEALELDGVELIYSGTSPERRRRQRSGRVRTADELARDILDEFTGLPPELVEVPVEIDGDLAPLIDGVTTLTIPIESIMSLSIDEQVPTNGRVVWTDDDDDPQTLVARFVQGAGEIIVVSDPQLFANRQIANGDNSVLAVQLLSPDGQAVRFDEFYHGLGVRGSPFYLLTRLPYATVTIGLLLLLGVWTWRESVLLCPPFPDVEPSRRDVSEYINAMGRFFAVGSQGRGPLVRHVHDGVLWQVSEEVGLPPDTGDVDRIAAAVARRDVRRGEKLVEATRAVETQLQTQRHWSKSQTLDAMQRMTDCLSKNATRPFEPNWKKSSSVKTT